MCILVVDDEKIIREGAECILVKEGWQTGTAENGREGLNLIATGSYQLLLLDLMMPGISGMEVLKNVRQSYPDVIVIVITGYATIENAVEAMKNGAYDFIAKPFTPDQLRIVVRRAFEKRDLMLETEALRRERRQRMQDFVNLVSHELRSPLNSIQQQLFNLLKGLAGEITSDQHMILERVQGRLSGLTGMIKNLLDVSRFETEPFLQNKEPVCLKEIVQEAVEICQDDAREKNITIMNKVSAKAAAVEADRQGLVSVFANLVSNAVKYNRAGGTVHVRSRSRGAHVEITVADNGIGIAPDHLERIFDRFFRIRTDETRHVIGSGLGLSLVKSIIKGHNGGIAVESVPGTGTDVTVRLPKSIQQLSLRAYSNCH